MGVVKRQAIIVAAVATLLGGAGQQASPKDETHKKVTAELPNLVKSADSNGNGTLNAAEFVAFASAVRRRVDAVRDELEPARVTKRIQKELKSSDKNGDAKLDDDEKKAAAEALMLKGIKDFDWDRDGKLSDKEKTAMQWAAEGRQAYEFRSVDTDGNGEVSAAEVTAAASALTGIKPKKAAP